MADKELLQVTKSMNILLLGPTGAGKSTWVNSIINYLTFNTFEEAEKSGPKIAISVCFTVWGKNHTQGELIKFEVEGSDEVLDARRSVTQFPKTYSFHWNDTLVRIIDTPGIDDLGEYGKDKENLRNTLDHISHLDEIHGICILLKADEPRPNFGLCFYITQLIANLHISVFNNFIFCFTNAGTTFYQPGSTLPVLNKLLNDISAEITLSDHTLYCINNESFNFLCTLSNPNVTYNQHERKIYIGSWEVSMLETKLMFQHIKQLTPYRTRDTVTLNEARRLILTLTKPMCDIIKNIQLNISLMKIKREEVERRMISETNLLENLFIPVIVWEPKELGHPRTVCTSSKCVEYRDLHDIKMKEICYKTVCHNRCYLKNVTAETNLTVCLKNYKAMYANYNCMNCGCSWSKHKHITYEQKSIEERVVNNKSIIEDFSSNKSMQEAIEALIKEMEKRVKSLDNETAKICKISARFGYFLKRHAIALYNDAMKAVLELQIQEEKNKPDPMNVDRELLAGLEQHLAHYEKEKLNLESSMNAKPSEVISASDIAVLIESLYRLPFSGECLRKTVEMAEGAQRKMISHNEQYFSLNKQEIEAETESQNSGKVRRALSSIKCQIL